MSHLGFAVDVFGPDANRHTHLDQAARTMTEASTHLKRRLTGMHTMRNPPTAAVKSPHGLLGGFM